MTLPTPPNITAGQIALDPVNGIVYYVDNNGNKVATTWSWLRQDLSEVRTDDNVTITGDLTVSGTTVSVNVESVVVADNILILNSNVTGVPSENAGIEIERGTSANVQIRWNESSDKWQFTNDGTNFYDINSITEDSVQLGYHTTGDYVENLTAGTGVSITSGTGEGSNPTIAIGQDVSTSATPTFAGVTAPLTGNVTGTVSSIANHSIDSLSDVVISSATPNQVLKFNGTNWVNGTSAEVYALNDLSDVIISSPEEFQTLEYDGTNWINKHASVVSYVRNVETTTITTGTVVYLFGSTGDHATVKRADNSSDVTSSKTVGVAGANIIANGNGPVITRGYVDGINLSTGYTAGDVLWLGSNGQFTKTKPSAPNHLVFIGVVVRATNNGIIYVATQNGYEIDELHDVSIISKTSGDFLKYNGSLWVNDQINLGTDTVGDYVGKLAAGTGISITNNSGEGSTPNISLNASLDNLTDVVISGVPTTNHVLLYNGSAWVNGASPGGGGGTSASPTSEGIVYGKTSLSGGTTFLGYNSGNNSVTGADNIAIGQYSQASVSTGIGNVGMGYGSLRNNATNNYSVAIGYSSLENSLGGYNVGIGYSALKGTVGTASGTFNVAIGANAGYSLQSGQYNIFLGYNSGYSVTTATHNIGIGYNALNDPQGTSNIGIGYGALGSAGGTLTGAYNISVGLNAGMRLQSGSNNIFIGQGAGAYNTSGSRNVFIGYTAGDTEYGSDKLYIANSNTSTPLIKGDFASSTVEINGSLTYRQAVNDQGLNTMVYLTASDKGKVVTFNASSNVTVYVNNFINLVAGERIDLLQLGSGQVTVSGFSVTLNGTPGLKLRAQYSAASLLCVSSNTFVLIGDLAA